MRTAGRPISASPYAPPRETAAHLMTAAGLGPEAYATALHVYPEGVVLDGSTGIRPAERRPSDRRHRYGMPRGAGVPGRVDRLPDRLPLPDGALAGWAPLLSEALRPLAFGSLHCHFRDPVRRDEATGTPRPDAAVGNAFGRIVAAMAAALADDLEEEDAGASLTISPAQGRLEIEVAFADPDPSRVFVDARLDPSGPEWREAAPVLFAWSSGCSTVALRAAVPPLSAVGRLTLRRMAGSIRGPGPQGVGGRSCRGSAGAEARA